MFLEFKAWKSQNEERLKKIMEHNLISWIVALKKQPTNVPENTFVRMTETYKHFCKMVNK